MARLAAPNVKRLLTNRGWGALQSPPRRAVNGLNLHPIGSWSPVQRLPKCRLPGYPSAGSRRFLSSGGPKTGDRTACAQLVHRAGHRAGHRAEHRAEHRAQSRAQNRDRHRLLEQTVPVPWDARPASSRAQTGLARRKPTLRVSVVARRVLRYEDDTLKGVLPQLPPRSPRFTPAVPSRSFH